MKKYIKYDEFIKWLDEQIYYSDREMKTYLKIGDLSSAALSKEDVDAYSWVKNNLEKSLNHLIVSDKTRNKKE